MVSLSVYNRTGHEVGTIEVPAGRHELSINALKIPTGGELARFIGVTLTPIK